MKRPVIVAILEPGFAWIDMETVEGERRRKHAGKLPAAAAVGGGATPFFAFPRFEGAIRLGTCRLPCLYTDIE